jgi:CIC family chloride channel protein
MNAIPFYFLLGIFCGLFSAYFIFVTNKIEKFFLDFKNNYVKIITGGIILGLLIFLLPPLYGEGYKSVESLFDGNISKLFERGLFYNFKDNQYFILVFAFSIIMLKVLATAVTIGAGGNGGTIAPSLFTGALVGFFFSRLLNTIGLVHLTESNFVAVGMAGVLSGVIHAPLTGIFLIAEVTGGYALIVPLMIVSAVAFFVSRYFEPFSVYTKILSEKGIWFPGNKDKHILDQIKLDSIIEDNFNKIKPNIPLREIINEFSLSQRNIFPVVDDNDKLLGIITLDDIREIILKDELYDIVLAFEIMTIPPAVIGKNDKMDEVMKKFENSNVWNLPVVDKDKYVGFVSKSSVFNKYRDLLIQQSNNPV